MEIHEDQGYVTELPWSCEKIRSRLLYQLDSEQQDLATPKICPTAEIKAR